MACLIFGVLCLPLPASATADVDAFDAALQAHRASVHREPRRDTGQLLARMQATLPADDELGRVQLDSSRCSCACHGTRISEGLDFALQTLRRARALGDDTTVVAELLCVSDYRRVSDTVGQHRHRHARARRRIKGGPGRARRPGAVLGQGQRRQSRRKWRAPMADAIPAPG
ncbi:MAG: hypothetical protein Q4F49_03030 [Pseudoxanthomonas suwonensis]|nr:hypothetical protein [Pseudoxanthomonas suwonensis]